MMRVRLLQALEQLFPPQAQAPAQERARGLAQPLATVQAQARALGLALGLALPTLVPELRLPLLVEPLALLSLWPGRPSLGGAAPPAPKPAQARAPAAT